MAPVKKHTHMVYVPQETGTLIGGGRWVEVDDNGNPVNNTGTNSVDKISGSALGNFNSGRSTRGCGGQCYSPGKREARPSGNNQSRAFHRLRFCPWRGNSFFDEAMWASFLAGQSRALFGCFMAVAFTLLISNASAGSTPVRHVRHRQHAYEARPVDVPLQPFSLDPPLPHPSTPIQVAYYAPPAVRRAEPIIHEEEDDVHAGFEMAGTSCPMVSGNRAVLRNGIAYAPANAPDRVKNAI